MVYYLFPKTDHSNMSYTFTLSGRDSILSTNIYPPITLDEGIYVLGLIDFVTYNTIPNVDESNNKFHYRENGKQVEIVFPEGSYEIEDIEKYINNHVVIKEVKRPQDVSNVIVKEQENSSLKISPNLNTLMCEIKWDKDIDFAKDNTIGSLLGFERKTLQRNMIHISDHPIDIFKVNTICIDCNLVTNSYTNSKPMHIIHMFYPTVPPGYKIIEHPTNVIYLPINSRSIDQILLKILDQHGNLINFKKELVTIRLHLKKFS